MTYPLVAPRLLQAMKRGGKKDVTEWSALALASNKYVCKLMSVFNECGLAHIAGWKRREIKNGLVAADWIPLWKIGQAENAPRPPRITQGEARAARKQRLRAAFGIKAANDILRPRKRGGVSVVMREGRLVYKRGAPRGGRQTEVSA